MAIGAQGKGSSVKDRGSRLKKFGAIDIGKQTKLVFKVLAIFLVINIMGVISTIWTDVFSPKWRAIDKAVSSLDIPADWEEVPASNDQGNDNIRDYFGSCRWVELLPQGCVSYTRYYKAKFTGDPRGEMSKIIEGGGYSIADATPTCGPVAEVGVGECGVYFYSHGRFSCGVSLPWKPEGFASSGGVAIRCTR